MQGMRRRRREPCSASSCLIRLLAVLAPAARQVEAMAALWEALLVTAAAALPAALVAALLHAGAKAVVCARGPAEGGAARREPARPEAATAYFQVTPRCAPEKPGSSGVAVSAALPSPCSGAGCRGPCGLRARGLSCTLHACRGPAAAAPALASPELKPVFQSVGCCTDVVLPASTRSQATAAASTWRRRRMQSCRQGAP